MPWEGMLGKCWNGCAMCWLFVQGWARALRAGDRRSDWSAQGLRAGAAASGDARANLGGHPAPRPPGDRHRHAHGWCRETLNP